VISQEAAMVRKLIVISFVLVFFVTLTSGSSPSLLPNPIIFVKQTKVNRSGGAIQDLFGNFEGANPALDQPVGGNLFLLNPGGELRQLIPSNRVAVRDPEISDDATKVIFAMKEGGDAKWQIWETQINGTGLRKISRDAQVNDFDPAYLPDGKIIFVSDRRQLADTFMNYPSAQMHIMNANGTGVKLLNANPSGHFNPIPSEFGAILFSEFDTHDRRTNVRDPLDRFAVGRFLPWLVYQDGSAFDHPIFGSHTIADFNGGYASVRSIPGTGLLLGVLADQQKTYGSGAIVKMNYGLNDDEEVPEFVTENVYAKKWNNRLGRWRDPYPMSTGSILASYAEGVVYQTKDVMSATEIPNFRIVMLSGDGKRQETIYEDSKFWCWQPVEVAPKPPQFIYSGFAQPEFRYAMINSLDVFNRGPNARKVVNGDSQPKLKRGTIDKVRFFALERQTNIHPEYQKYSDQRLIPLGEAPVFPDGSFAALVPVDTPVMWDLIDKKGRVAVQERFGTTLKGGEVRTCYGCHAPHDGRTGNLANQALHFATNLTRYDPDTDDNGIIDILEGGGVIIDPLRHP
jgi:hypothetical protein